MNCNKRLDPGGLVEHDTDVSRVSATDHYQAKITDPPCISHTAGTVTFSCSAREVSSQERDRPLDVTDTTCPFPATNDIHVVEASYEDLELIMYPSDLRHSNLHPSSPASTPSQTPIRRPLPSTPTHMSTKPPTPRTFPPPTEYYTPPQLSSSVPVTPEYTTRDPCTPITRPNFQDPRPISVPYAGKRENFDDRGLLRRGDSPRTKVGERVVMGEEMCWGCEKRVYNAEQVSPFSRSALCGMRGLISECARYSHLVTSERAEIRPMNSTDNRRVRWHRGCLRCEWCKSTIEPGKVSDRRGAPICKHCYSKVSPLNLA